MTAEEVKNEQPESVQKSGMKMCGYTIPWWVLIIVVLLIVYLAYDQGYLKNVMGSETRQMSMSTPMQSGGNYDFGVDTPVQVRELFRGM